jgi:N-acetylglucosamine-6-phosphate deacetylase
MADVVRLSVLDSGLSVAAASRAASGRPAQVLGLADRFGSLAAGRVADVVALDDDLRVRAVMRGGEWSTPPSKSELLLV